jgi:uncharacterized membrane protein
MSVPPERERETVVVTNNDGGGGPGALIAGVIVAALVVIGVIYFLNVNQGSGGTVDVDVPAVEVDVVPDGQ